MEVRLTTNIFMMKIVVVVAAVDDGFTTCVDTHRRTVRDIVVALVLVECRLPLTVCACLCTEFDWTKRNKTSPVSYRTLTFLGLNDSERNRTAYEFPVFQAGPRICLGMNMAVLEAKLCIVNLVSQFDFKPGRKCVLPPRYNTRITQSIRDGLPVTVSRRQKQ